MNIGIRLHDLDGQGLEGKLNSAQTLGFTCVHLALSKVEPGFSMEDAPITLTEEYAKTVREKLERYGQQAAVLGCYLNLATPDMEELKRTVDCYIAHLRFAAKIGAKMVGTETGAPNTGDTQTEECFTEEALHLFVDRLRPVAEVAQDVGVPIAIEPVCRHIVHTPQKARQVLDALQSPYCKIILDPVNLLNEQNVKRQKEIFSEAIALLGKDVLAVHWKDYLLRDGELQSVAGGMGEMAGESVLRFLAQHEQMPVTLEDTQPGNAGATRALLAAQLTAMAGDIS